MCNFKIGEKVVCVDDFFSSKNPMETFPIKNEIYTIRGIYNGVGIYLEEIINPILFYREGFGECNFYVDRFRKLDNQFAEDVIAYITELETVNI